MSDLDGRTRTFHLLDSWAGRTGQPELTLLCIHGNPTWSYLWRRLLAAAPPEWRVVAPDQLGMGYSERLERPRTLAERVDDLGRLTDVLEVSGPVVTVAHDWGGIISIGWALRHRQQLRGLVLTNTAVHQPDTSAGPLLIRLAHRRWINELACRRFPVFVRAATALSRPRLDPAVRSAFAAPYSSVRRRAAVAEFVTDIPFSAGHPSRPVLDEIANGLAGLDRPALLLWGPRDPVFAEEHLRDLRKRLPHAVLHRFEKASHLLPEDAPQYTDAILNWVGQLGSPPGVDAPARPQLGSALSAFAARKDSNDAAVVESAGRSISWTQLHGRVRDIAAGLQAAGVRPGDRVALLVPPSIELTVALYAVWRAGAVIVVADKGLGLRGMGRALRSAELNWLIAATPGLLAARGMRLPGTRIAVRPNGLPFRLARLSLPTLAAVGTRQQMAPDLPPPEADAEAAVLFTSGATGPAKGVRYQHRQVAAQLELIRTTYRLTSDDRIVAAFAPFALYGPALGIPSAVPDTDVTKPGTLTAAALADAAIRIGATVVFASPAALRNVFKTALRTNKKQRAALARVRLLLSAGAPVPAELLQRLQLLLPNAEMHTPYGMTEALPITDISLPEILDAGSGDGVCVGRALPGVEMRLAALEPTGTPATELTAEPGVSGEIWVRAAHVKASYDALWLTDQAAATHPGWHRTGDIGQLDDQGRWWIQGRIGHLIKTANGPVTPVGVEQRVQTAIGDALGEVTAAVVGVGPAGTQQVVVVLTGRKGPLATAATAALVREAAQVEVAAVLIRESLPVDIRHNSKIDRAAVSEWAGKVLAGR